MEKILVVDDERTVLLVLEKQLTDEGYSVVTTTSGYSAVDLADSEMPDLVILDLSMPDIGGEMVAEHLRGNDKTKDIPIIFLTALLPKEQESHDHVVDGNIMFAKPYDPAELLDEIRKQIENSKAAQKIS